MNTKGNYGTHFQQKIEIFSLNIEWKANHGIRTFKRSVIILADDC